VWGERERERSYTGRSTGGSWGGEGGFAHLVGGSDSR
jgi:hypothetical protein